MFTSQWRMREIICNSKSHVIKYSKNYTFAGNTCTEGIRNEEETESDKTLRLSLCWIIVVRAVDIHFEFESNFSGCHITQGFEHVIYVDDDLPWAAHTRKYKQLVTSLWKLVGCFERTQKSRILQLWGLIRATWHPSNSPSNCGPLVSIFFLLIYRVMKFF